MVFIGVELSPKHKRHKLQGASIMDTKKSRQPGAICDDNVGNMASGKPGLHPQTLLHLGPAHIASEREVG